MLIKGIFTNVSGSIGGVTGAHNKGGQYLRARTTPTNPNTSNQQLARSRFSSANEQWSNLSAEDRNAWALFGEQQTWQNSLGDTIQLSGQQAFVGMVSALLSAGLTTITSPPPPNTRPSAIIIPEFAPEFGDGDVGDFTPGEQTSADRYVISASAPLPPGVTRFKGPFTIGQVIAGDAIASALSVAAYEAIEAINGTPSLGNRYAIRVRTVLATGQYSTDAIRISEPTIDT